MDRKELVSSGWHGAPSTSEASSKPEMIGFRVSK